MKKLTLLLLIVIFNYSYADTITLPQNSKPQDNAITQYCTETTQNINGKQVKVTMCRLTNGQWYIKQ